MSFIVLIRGGGDIASGVALRLHHAGLRVVVAELPQPLAVRRKVSFSEAVYAGEMTVEGVTARRVADPTDTLRVLRILAKAEIPVLIDPHGESISALHPAVVVDGRMLKLPVELLKTPVTLLIGLGPGFVAGHNCHVAVETNRGHFLGRVVRQGSTEPDTGLPEKVDERGADRVLRAPLDGLLVAHAEIGDLVATQQLIAEVGGQPVLAPFDGVLRGLIYPGLSVTRGLKIGDVDPRRDVRLCTLVSDKSLAVGGGVLEAILSRPELRPQLWT